MEFSCSQYGSQSSMYGGQSSQYSAPNFQNRYQPTAKSAKSRRSWSLLEEKVLLQSFTEIIAQGWKSQNGFRNGFLSQLESKMKVALPGTDIRGEPHISSKYGSWKKTWRDVTQVLSQSGFNWVSGTKTVDALPEVWDSYCQAHPTYAYIREKPFPFFEIWVEIYGKDRANGNGAADFHNPAGEGAPQPPPPPPATQVNSHYTPTVAEGEDVQETPPTHNGCPTEEVRATSEKSASPTEISSRKRKRSEQNEEVMELIASMWAKATEALEKVAIRIGHECDETDMRTKLYNVIGELPMALTRTEHLDASYELAMNEKAMDLFFGLPESAKCDLVRRALDGKLK